MYLEVSMAINEAVELAMSFKVSYTEITRLALVGFSPQPVPRNGVQMHLLSIA